MNRPDLSFSSPSSAADEGLVRSLKTKNHTAPSHLLRTQLVSAEVGGAVVPILPDNSAVEASEHALDAHIVDLAAKAVAAEAQGDRTGARLYVRKLYAAINSRSAAHQRRLNDEDPCYFSLMGELAAAQRTAP